MRLTKQGSNLVTPEGDHFSGLMPTAFLLCSPNYPLSFTKGYIDRMKSAGAAGFRAAINVYWGPNHQGEHGGNTIFWNNETELINRINDVLSFLEDRGMYLILEILDSSLHIAIGENRYYDQSLEWERLFSAFAMFNHLHPNLIVGTGNEPSKGLNKQKVTAFQFWAVDKLKKLAAAQGDQILIAAEINEGTGIPALAGNPKVDILGFKSSRIENEMVLHETYNQLTGLKHNFPEKVIWGQEPPRRNYPNFGSWCSDDAILWLIKIAYLHLGSLYTPHGLGHGQEEQRPEENGFFFWGVGGGDPVNYWQAYNYLMRIIRRPPAGKKSRCFFDFDPSMIFYSGNGLGFVSSDFKDWIIISNENQIKVSIEDAGRFMILDLKTGGVEWNEKCSKANR